MMNIEQLTCPINGHDNQVILGICLSEYCQADQKITCINCLQKIHAKCMTEFCSTQQFIKRLTEMKIKTQQHNEYETISYMRDLIKQTEQFNKVVDSFVKGFNQSYDKEGRINLIEQILVNQTQLSFNDWEQGYNLLTNQSVQTVLNSDYFIEQLHISRQLIDKVLAMNKQNKIYQRMALSNQKQRIAQPWLIETPILGQERLQMNSVLGRDKIIVDQLCKTNWNTITVQKPLIIDAQHRIKTISLSPDSKYIASAGDNDNYSIKIWDPILRRQVGNDMRGHKDMITSINYSKCGKYLVSGSADKTICQWDTLTYQQAGKSIKGHQEEVTGVQYSGDRSYIVSCSRDATIRFWNSESGIEYIENHIEHGEQILCLSLSPIQTNVVVGDLNGLITIYNYQRQQKRGYSHQGHKHCVNSIQYSIDGKLIASASDDNTIKLWDATSFKSIRSFRDHTSYVLSVNFSPDKRYLISGGCDRTVRIWSQATGRPIGDPLTHHQKQVCSTQFSLDGKYIITGGWGSQLRIMVAPIVL